MVIFAVAGAMGSNAMFNFPNIPWGNRQGFDKWLAAARERHASRRAEKGNLANDIPINGADGHQIPADVLVEHLKLLGFQEAAARAYVDKHPGLGGAKKDGLHESVTPVLSGLSAAVNSRETIAETPSTGQLVIPYNHVTLVLRRPRAAHLRRVYETTATKTEGSSDRYRPYVLDQYTASADKDRLLELLTSTDQGDALQQLYSEGMNIPSDHTRVLVSVYNHDWIPNQVYTRPDVLAKRIPMATTCAMIMGGAGFIGHGLFFWTGSAKLHAISAPVTTGLRTRLFLATMLATPFILFAADRARDKNSQGGRMLAAPNLKKVGGHWVSHGYGPADDPRCLTGKFTILGRNTVVAYTSYRADDPAATTSDEDPATDAAEIDGSNIDNSSVAISSLNDDKKSGGWGWGGGRSEADRRAEEAFGANRKGKPATATANTTSSTTPTSASNAPTPSAPPPTPFAPAPTSSEVTRLNATRTAWLEHARRTLSMIEVRAHEVANRPNGRGESSELVELTDQFLALANDIRLVNKSYLQTSGMLPQAHQVARPQVTFAQQMYASEHDITLAENYLKVQAHAAEGFQREQAELERRQQADADERARLENEARARRAAQARAMGQTPNPKDEERFTASAPAQAGPSSHALVFKARIAASRARIEVLATSQEALLAARQSEQDYWDYEELDDRFTVELAWLQETQRKAIPRYRKWYTANSHLAPMRKGAVPNFASALGRPIGANRPATHEARDTGAPRPHRGGDANSGTVKWTDPQSLLTHFSVPLVTFGGLAIASIFLTSFYGKWRIGVVTRRYNEYGATTSAGQTSWRSTSGDVVESPVSPPFRRSTSSGGGATVIEPPVKRPLEVKDLPPKAPKSESSTGPWVRTQKSTAPPPRPHQAATTAPSEALSGESPITSELEERLKAMEEPFEAQGKTARAQRKS